MENDDAMYDEPCYVISVAARMVELHPQTLRYYERVGLVNPTRSEGNRRLYSPRDIERLRAINRMIDELGVNLAGVEVIFNMRKKMQEMQAEMDRTRAEFEAEIARLRSLLDDMS
jgi:MerR family transcriptional regulator/heat shock protein HspR